MTEELRTISQLQAWVCGIYYRMKCFPKTLCFTHFIMTLWTTSFIPLYMKFLWRNFWGNGLTPDGRKEDFKRNAASNGTSLHVEIHRIHRACLTGDPSVSTNEKLNNESHRWIRYRWQRLIDCGNKYFCQRIQIFGLSTTPRHQTQSAAYQTTG